MEPENYLNENQAQTLITALGICVKNGFLQLSLQTRLVNESFNRLVCLMPPAISINFTDYKYKSKEVLASLLSKVKIRDLCLRIPGPDYRYKHYRYKPGTPSRRSYLGLPKYSSKIHSRAYRKRMQNTMRNSIFQLSSIVVQQCQLNPFWR